VGLGVVWRHFFVYTRCILADPTVLLRSVRQHRKPSPSPAHGPLLLMARRLLCSSHATQFVHFGFERVGSVGAIAFNEVSLLCVETAMYWCEHTIVVLLDQGGLLANTHAMDARSN